MQTLTHKILDGEVTLYKQPLSKNWFCRFYVNRVRYATTTKTDDLLTAKEAAKEFFFDTQVKIKNCF